MTATNSGRLDFCDKHVFLLNRIATSKCGVRHGILPDLEQRHVLHLQAFDLVEIDREAILWKLTQKGAKFLYNNLTVPRWFRLDLVGSVREESVDRCTAAEIDLFCLVEEV